MCHGRILVYPLTHFSDYEPYGRRFVYGRLLARVRSADTVTRTIIVQITDSIQPRALRRTASGQKNTTSRRMMPGSGPTADLKMFIPPIIPVERNYA